MPIFIGLGIATDEGLKNLEGFALRHTRAVERAEASGVKFIASYVLTGHYDYLVIFEADDLQTALKVLTREAEGGNIRYETLPALPIEEFAELLIRPGLPKKKK
jgi:uncharacterized protein with GYD domain